MNILNTLIDLWQQWQTHRRGQRELARLDDYQLKDIGLTRADVYRELAQPFWRRLRLSRKMES